MNEITITSLPIKWDMEANKSLGYDEKFRQTLTLTRDKAKALLEKYYGHSDFTTLFGEERQDGTYDRQVPNKELKKMMFNDQGEPTLNKAFDELD